MEVKTTAPATTPRWGRTAPRFARGPAGARKFQMFLGSSSHEHARRDITHAKTSDRALLKRRGVSCFLAQLRCWDLDQKSRIRQ